MQQQALTHMQLSHASIGNLERLSRCIDAGFLKDQSHKESIKIMQWPTRLWVSSIGHTSSAWLACCQAAFSRPKTTSSRYIKKVEALLRTGELQSIAAPGRAAGRGGSSVPEKIRPAKKRAQSAGRPKQGWQRRRDTATLSTAGPRQHSSR